MKDVFKEAHRKLKSSDFDGALRLLINGKTGELRHDFASDKNHAWYLVGDTLFKKRQFEASIEAFMKALKERNDDVEAIWAIADCYSEMGDPKNAEKYLRMGLELNPEDERLVYNLGNALFDQRKYEEALSWYNKISCGSKNSDSELCDLVNKNIAACNMNMKRFDLLMPYDNNYNLRQAVRLLHVLEEFDEHKTDINKYVNDIEALIFAFENIEDDVRNKLLASWGGIEEVYAVALDEGKSFLDNDDVAEIYKRTHSLISIINKEFMNKNENAL